MIPSKFLNLESRFYFFASLTTAQIKSAAAIIIKDKPINKLTSKMRNVEVVKPETSAETPNKPLMPKPTKKEPTKNEATPETILNLI